MLNFTRVRYVYKSKNIFLQILLFSSRSKILILLYVVLKLMQKMSKFHGKTAGYDVLKIKFVDISHHRYKLGRYI
jgi:hypothetical protein